MGGNLLSDAALHQVRELIRQESGRARGERTWEVPPLHKGSECFLAYNKDGIDPIKAGKPSVAECDLYERDLNNNLVPLMMDATNPNVRDVYNASKFSVIPGFFPIWKDKLGTWWAVPITAIIGGCLAENHPGRGVAFNLTLGTWDATQTKWLYNISPNVKAIDWRYGVPYPDAGATGLFHPKASDTYGTIWECVSLDCESPGACESE
jgi:hypothetical protein